MERSNYDLAKGWKKNSTESLRHLVITLGAHYIMNLRANHVDIAEHIQTLLKKVRAEIKTRVIQ